MHNFGRHPRRENAMSYPVGESIRDAQDSRRKNQAVFRAGAAPARWFDPMDVPDAGLLLNSDFTGYLWPRPPHLRRHASPK
jgi:hypothetical protein